MNWILIIVTVLALMGCETNKKPMNNQSVYKDVPYVQDYSVKYYFENDDHETKKVYTDRNEVVQVLTEDGLYFPVNGHLQYPGSLKRDKRYLPMADKKVADFVIYDNQFVYVDEKAVFSNAWAGKLYSKHNLPKAKIICGSTDFGFMLSDGKNLVFIKDSKQLCKGDLTGDKILSIKYNQTNNEFLILNKNSLFSFSIQNDLLKQLYNESNLAIKMSLVELVALRV